MKTILIVVSAVIVILLAGCGGGAPATPSSSSGTQPTAVPAANTEPAAAQPTLAAEPTTAAAATDTPEPTAAPQPTSAPANQSSGGVPIGNIRDVMNKACAALKAQPNVTADLTITSTANSKTTNGKLVYQVQGQDTIRLTGNMDGEDVGLVALPGVIYIQQGGTWQKQQISTSATKQIAQTEIQAGRAGLGTFICFEGKPNQLNPFSGELGTLQVNMALPEIVNGVPTLVYVVNVTINTTDTQGSGTGKYWLGATDSLPRKIVIDYKGQTMSGQMQIVYSYDNPNIQPPIP